MADDKKKGALVPAGGKSVAVPGGKGKSGGALAALKAGAVSVPTVKLGPSKQELVAIATAGPKPRLVFGFDATASRAPSWNQARRVTNSLFGAIPGSLEVNLAVHGGSCLHTWTEFTADPARLRDKAASIRCSAGETRLNDILARSLDERGVKVVLYAGDAYEEDPMAAYELARSLKLRGARVICLHERSGNPNQDDRVGKVFGTLADLTGGACIPFDTAAVEELRSLLAAIAALATGGVKLLRQSKTEGAKLLLTYLRKDDE